METKGMGWDYHHELAPYDRRAICRNRIGNGYEVVKDAVVGTTYYAAVKSPHDGSVSALVILTHIDRNGYCNFGMKFMDEECWPVRCECPKSVLDVPNPHNLPTSRPVWKGELVPSGIWCGGDCSACAVKDEGCWSLKPGERILFEAH